MATAPIPYTEIRSQLKTGDLLTFEGHLPLDFMINLLEEGSYSHVGMVLTDPSGELLFWDAPGVGTLFPDPFYPNHAPHTGCRAAAIDTVVGYYVKDMDIKGFTWRQLTPAIDPQTYKSLLHFVQQAEGVAFPGDKAVISPQLLAWMQKNLPPAYLPSPDTMGISLGLLLTYLTGSVLRIPTTDSYFCAQLAAATYMAMGLLPHQPLPSNGYAPAAFDDQPSPLTLLRGFKLGPPTPVVWDGPPYMPPHPLSPPA